MEILRVAGRCLRSLATLCLWITTTAQAQFLGGPLTIQWQKEYGSIYYESATYIRDWRLVLRGFSNVVYSVEASTNLATWSHIQTIRMAGAPTEILRHSEAAATNTYMFYLAAIVP